MALTSRVIGSFSFVIQMINDASDYKKNRGLVCKMIPIKKFKAKQERAATAAHEQLTGVPFDPNVSALSYLLYLV